MTYLDTGTHLFVKVPRP